MRAYRQDGAPSWRSETKGNQMILVSNAGGGSIAASILVGLLLVGCSGPSDAPEGSAAANGSDVSIASTINWAPETFTLANGMDVVVLPDHRVPVVTHMVWYRVGAADEPAGQSGIAHFLEHLMFKGTDTLGPGEFSQIVAQNGGVDNAFTSYDYTAYFQRVALDRLELFMGYEADRMTHLNIPEDHFYAERDVVLEEARMGLQDIGQIMDVEMSRTLWPSHPYGVPIAGWVEEIGAVEPDQVMAFYNTWYAPNNAILVVAGDITAEELRPMAERTYGQIPARPVPERQRPGLDEPRSADRINLEHELAGERYLYRYYEVPSFQTGGNDLGAALSVGMSILDGGSTEWLYRDLVIDQGLATLAGGYYWGSTHDDGQIVMYAVPNEGVGFEELEAAMDAVVARYLAEGPTPEQLHRTIVSSVSSAIYAQDDQVSMAQLFGRGLASGRSLDDIMGWAASIEAVTAADVQAAMAAVLVPEQAVTGTLSPLAALPIDMDVKSAATGLSEGEPASDDAEDKKE